MQHGPIISPISQDITKDKTGGQTDLLQAENKIHLFYGFIVYSRFSFPFILKKEILHYSFTLGILSVCLSESAYLRPLKYIQESSFQAHAKKIYSVSNIDSKKENTILCLISTHKIREKRKRRKLLCF